MHRVVFHHRMIGRWESASQIFEQIALPSGQVSGKIGLAVFVVEGPLCLVKALKPPRPTPGECWQVLMGGIPGGCSSMAIVIEALVLLQSRIRGNEFSGGRIAPLLHRNSMLQVGVDAKNFGDLTRSHFIPRGPHGAFGPTNDTMSRCTACHLQASSPRKFS